MDSESRQQKALQYRCDGGGRKLTLDGHEEEIFNEIMDLRGQKIRVTRKRVFKIAIAISEKYNIVGFKCSSKWIKGFFRRFRLSLRLQSSLQTIGDDVIVERSVAYMIYLKYLLCGGKYSFAAENIVAMDKMAVYFSSSQTATVDVTNTSSIVVKGTGFDSERMTCIVAIKPNGTLLKTFHDYKGKRRWYNC